MGERGNNRLTGQDCGYCERPTRTGPLGGPDFDTAYDDEDGDGRHCCWFCLTSLSTIRARLAKAEEERDRLRTLLEMWAEDYPRHCNFHRDVEYDDDPEHADDCLRCDTLFALNPTPETPTNE